MKLKLTIVSLIMSFFMSSAMAETVNFYTYHLSPPFVTGDDQGLTYDFAKYLSAKSNGKFEFVVKELPRNRLNEVIQSTDLGVVPWVMPAWFQDKEEGKYLWTKGFFEDGNALMSPASKKVEFTGDFSSLHGMTFGGVRGHSYQGIDDAVAGGNIKRQDAQSIEANLQKLAVGRIDISSAADSASRFLVSQMGLSSDVHFSTKPHTQYNRRMFVMKGLTDVHTFLADTVNGMGSDSAWQDIVGKYK